jgi:hypothetical protein
VLGFAVPQFVGGQAHRVLQRLADSPTAQLRLRSAHLLQPLAGILLELWQAEQRGPAAAGGGSSSDGSGSGSGSSSDGGGSGGDGGSAAATPVAGVWASSLLRALSSQAALTDGVLQGLLAAEVCGAAAARPSPAASKIWHCPGSTLCCRRCSGCCQGVRHGFGRLLTPHAGPPADG